jgi:hypothetical protein
VNYIPRPPVRSGSYERLTTSNGLFPVDLTPLRHGGLWSYSRACFRALDGANTDVAIGLEYSARLIAAEPTKKFTARLALPGEIASGGRSAQHWKEALALIAYMPAGSTVLWGDGSVWISYPHFIQVLIPLGNMSDEGTDEPASPPALRFEHFARNDFISAVRLIKTSGQPILACTPPIAVTPAGLKAGWL